MMTTQVYLSLSSLPSKLSNKYVTFSAVANAVIFTTISNMSPSSNNNNNNNPSSLDINDDACDTPYHLSLDNNNNDIDFLGRTLFYGCNDSSYYYTQTKISYGTCTTNDGHTGENDIDCIQCTIIGL